MKKLKLLFSISTLCFALAVLCFGVLAATSVTYNLGGSVIYEVKDVFATVTTRVYTSSFADKSTLAAEAQKYVDGTGTGVDTNYKFDFQTKGLDSETFSNKTEVADYPDNNTEGINVEYNTTDKRTYFIVVSVTNNGDNVISAKATTSLENSNTLTSNVAQISKLEKNQTKRLVFTFMLDDITKGVNGADFEYIVNINNGELKQTFAEVQYLNNDESYSLSTKVSMDSATINLDKITCDNNHSLLNEDMTVYLYNFNLSNIDLSLANYVNLSVDLDNKDVLLYFIPQNFNNIEDIVLYLDGGGNCVYGTGSTSFETSLSNGPLSFCIIMEEPTSFDIRIVLSKLESFGKVDILSNYQSNFSTNAFSGDLFKSIQRSSVTVNVAYDILKIDLKDITQNNFVANFYISYNYTSLNNLGVFLLSENDIEAYAGKSFNEYIVENGWESLIGLVSFAELYIVPSYGTNGYFEYCDLDLNSTTYYVLCYDNDDTIDQTQLNIGISLSDYQSEIYTLSEDGTYYTFTKLKDKTITEYTVKSTYGEDNLPVKAIGDNAFRNASVTKVIMPDSIESLGVSIFYGCKIASFEIPKNVTTLVKGTFTGAKFGTLIIPNTVIEIQEFAFYYDSAFWSKGSDADIDNLIIRCSNSAFIGDITNSDQDFDQYIINNLIIYESELCSWVLRSGPRGYYIQKAIYVNSEYLSEMQEKYSEVADLLKAME